MRDFTPVGYPDKFIQGSEIPLTPTPEYRREIGGYRDDCYPTVSEMRDSTRGVVIVNVTCDHGASAQEFTEAELTERLDGHTVWDNLVFGAVERMLEERHPGYSYTIFGGMGLHRLGWEPCMEAPE